MRFPRRTIVNSRLETFFWECVSFWNTFRKSGSRLSTYRQKEDRDGLNPGWSYVCASCKRSPVLLRRKNNFSKLRTCFIPLRRTTQQRYLELYVHIMVV